jgi:hypothetical protein
MRFSRKAVFCLILLPLLAVTIVNVLYLWRQTTNPGDTNNPESLAVHWILKASRSEAIYTDFRNPPYNLTSYGPVYYLTIGKLTKWFQWSSDSIFINGRRFILFCSLLIAFLIGWRIRDETKNAMLALIGICFFLSSYILFPIATTCRPDLLAALFSLSGLLVFLKAPTRTSGVIAILLFVAAYFTKQSYISAPISLIFFQFLRNKRNAMLMALLYSGCVSGILLIMHLATGGLSTLNMIVSNMGPMKWLNLRIVTNTFLQTSPLTIIIGVVAVAFGGRRRLESIYFLVSLFVAMLISAKTGSAVNYFIEPLIGASLLAPLTVQAASELRLMRIMLITTVWVLMFPQFNFLIRSLQTLQFPVETEVRTLVTHADGHVLSDSPRLAFLAPDPIFLDALNLSFMELQGRWNSDGLVQMLRNRQIQYVILTAPVEQSSTWQGFHRFPEKLLQTIQSDCRLWRIVDGYYVYIPVH